jgi:hypothetical protein
MGGVADETDSSEISRAFIAAVCIAPLWMLAVSLELDSHPEGS